MKSYITLLGAAFSLFLLPSVSFAQTNPEPVVTTSQMVVASVNVTNLVVKESPKGRLVGSFVIKGEMGQQNDVAYGVIGRTKEGKITEVMRLGSTTGIREGELRPISFVYDIPAYVLKDTTLYLVSETEKGLPLGTQKLGVSQNVTAPELFSCVTKGEGVECTAKDAATLTANWYKGSRLGKSSFTEDKTFKANEKATFTKGNVTPGNYTVIIRDLNKKGFVALPVKIAGDYGSLLSVVVSADKTGAVHAVAVVRTSVKNTSVKVDLSAPGKGVCGSKTEKVEGGAVSVLLPSACQEGVVKVTLVTATGDVLDAYTSSFNVVKVVPASKDKAKGGALSALSSWAWVVLALFILISTFGMWHYLRTKKSKLYPPFFVLALLFTLHTGSTHALSISATTMYGGDIAHFGSGSIVTDKSSYAPGETIYITSDGTIDYDAGALPGYGVFSAQQMTVGDVGVPPYIGYLDSGDIDNGVMPAYVGPQPSSYTIPGGTSSGSYGLDVRAAVFSKNASYVQYASNKSYSTLPYDVVAPAPVDVNLQLTSVFFRLMNLF